MSVIATALKHMLAAGMAPDAIVSAVAEMEASAAPVIDPVMERKRERDRQRMRDKRDSRATSRDSSDIGDAPPALSLPPQTPPTHTHTPPDITTRVRPAAFAKPNGFARFWEAYPNKVGKAAAEKSYLAACRKIAGPDPPAEILAGVERAKQSRAWAEGYIPHPTTWLNQGRWEDEPNEAEPQPRKANDRPDHDQRPTPREDSLRAMHAGAMAALDRRRAVVG